MSYLGQRRNVLIAGRIVPGVIVGEPTTSTIQVPSKDPTRAGQMANIPVVRADVITLRETNPANGPVRTYLTITPENLRFTTPRFEGAVGLDFDEKGERISLQELVHLTEDSMAAFQLERLATRQEPEFVLEA